MPDETIIAAPAIGKCEQRVPYSPNQTPLSISRCSQIEAAPPDARKEINSSHFRIIAMASIQVHGMRMNVNTPRAQHHTLNKSSAEHIPRALHVDIVSL